MFLYVFSPPKPYTNSSTLHSVSHRALTASCGIYYATVSLVILHVLKSIKLQTIHKQKALTNKKGKCECNTRENLDILFLQLYPTNDIVDYMYCE